MAFIKRSKFAVIFFFVLVLVITYFLKVGHEIYFHLSIDFSQFNNETGVENLIVPNLIHYINFDQTDLSFVSFVCILSAFYNHKPTNIYFHSNVQLVGRYWDILEKVLGANLREKPLSKPSHVFGQQLSSVQHSADVARIKVLMQYGGIALDQDVFVVRNLNKFRHFEASVGWPRGQNLGSQVLVAHKQARLLQLWLDLYKEYRPTMWYYNAGESPTSNILLKRPELVHRVEEEFGVENLADELYRQNWPGWVHRSTIHLLDRHKGYLTNSSAVDETNYQTCDCTIGVLVKQMMDNLAEEGIKLGKEEGDSSFEDVVKAFLISNSSSLLKKHLTRQMFSTLKDLKTPTYKSTFREQITSGLVNPDSALGVYASDSEAYDTFSPLFDLIIRDYHRVQGRFLRHPPPNWGQTGDVGWEDLGDRVISSRIRLARNLAGFPFSSRMTKEDYLLLEQKVRTVLEALSGELGGRYVSLVDMEKAEQAVLVKQHLMFPGKCEDRFLKAAGACNHWPSGRGIFLNQDRTFVVWVGEEDHLRLISIQKGGDLATVYTRLVEGVTALERQLAFSRSERLGHLSFCPSNLGTGLRASVHLTLPHLGTGEVERLAGERGLQVRGEGGEHTGVVRGVLDLSNRRRLGVTEVQAVETMHGAVAEIIKIDKETGSQGVTVKP